MPIPCLRFAEPAGAGGAGVIGANEPTMEQNQAASHQNVSIISPLKGSGSDSNSSKDSRPRHQHRSKSFTLLPLPSIVNDHRRVHNSLGMHHVIGVSSNPTLARLVSGGVLRSSSSSTSSSSSGSRPHRSRLTSGGDDGGGSRRPREAGSGGEGVKSASVFDLPRFASTLKRLTAVKSRLWNRWDLSQFGPLRTLEVSFAKRTTLEQLARKVRRQTRRSLVSGGGGYLSFEAELVFETGRTCALTVQSAAENAHIDSPLQEEISAGRVVVGHGAVNRFVVRRKYHADELVVFVRPCMDVFPRQATFGSVSWVSHPCLSIELSL